MFIDRSVNPLPNPFGGAEIQLELHPPATFPLLRTEPEDYSLRSINMSPVRQGKLGVSNWVQVPVEQGLTNHSYRVLQP